MRNGTKFQNRNRNIFLDCYFLFENKLYFLDHFKSVTKNVLKCLRKLCLFTFNVLVYLNLVHKSTKNKWGSGSRWENAGCARNSKVLQKFLVKIQSEKHFLKLWQSNFKEIIQICNFHEIYALKSIFIHIFYGFWEENVFWKSWEEM